MSLQQIDSTTPYYKCNLSANIVASLYIEKKKHILSYNINLLQNMRFLRYSFFCNVLIIGETNSRSE